MLERRIRVNERRKRHEQTRCVGFQLGERYGVGVGSATTSGSGSGQISGAIEPVIDSNPEKAGQLIKDEIAKWAPIVKATDMKAR